MKKMIAAVLCLALALSFVACSRGPNPENHGNSESGSEYVLTGTVLAIEDGAMTVEVKENFPDSDPIAGMKSTELNLPITNMPASPEPVVGDTLAVTYNGTITATTPEGGADIYCINSADIAQIEVKR